jgi:hypothetical protein
MTAVAVLDADVAEKFREWPVDNGPLIGDTFETLLAIAARALDDLFDIDLSELDAPALEALVVGTEGLRRTAEAATIRVTAHIDEVQPFRADGFVNAGAYLKHRLQLSGQEAYRRVQMARQRTVLERWAATHAAGAIGTAQYRLMARIATNTRIDPHVVRAGSIDLWCDALDCSYREFERRALTWETLADPTSAHDKPGRAAAVRDISVRPLDTGGWAIAGRFDDIGGEEFNNIFARLVDKAHGNTVPHNGGPLCRHHNLRKEHGYQVIRYRDGTWHTDHPNGHEIH